MMTSLKQPILCALAACIAALTPCQASPKGGAAAELNPEVLEAPKEWVLESWSANAKLLKEVDNQPPTISFKQGSAAGYAGVNQFFGKSEADNTGRFSIGAMGMTKIGGIGPAMEVEILFTGILTKITTWKMDGGFLVLSDGTENNQLRFKPVVLDAG